MRPVDWAIRPTINSKTNIAPLIASSSFKVRASEAFPSASGAVDSSLCTLSNTCAPRLRGMRRPSSSCVLPPCCTVSTRSFRSKYSAVQQPTHRASWPCRMRISSARAIDFFGTERSGPRASFRSCHLRVRLSLVSRTAPKIQGRQLLGDPGGLARVHHPELPMGQIEGHRPNPGQTTQRHANEVLLGGAVHSAGN